MLTKSRSFQIVFLFVFVIWSLFAFAPSALAQEPDETTYSLAGVVASPPNYKGEVFEALEDVPGAFPYTLRRDLETPTSLYVGEFITVEGDDGETIVGWDGGYCLTSATDPDCHQSGSLFFAQRELGGMQVWIGSWESGDADCAAGCETPILVVPEEYGYSPDDALEAVEALIEREFDFSAPEFVEPEAEDEGPSLADLLTQDLPDATATPEAEDADAEADAEEAGAGEPGIRPLSEDAAAFIEAGEGPMDWRVITELLVFYSSDERMTFVRAAIGVVNPDDDPDSPEVIATAITAAAPLIEGMCGETPEGAVMTLVDNVLTFPCGGEDVSYELTLPGMEG